MSSPYDSTECVLPAELESRYGRLRHLLREIGSVAVGLSGGVDSTLLLRVAQDEPGVRVVAVVGESEAFPAGEVEEAVRLAGEMGAEVVRVRTHELANPHFAVNRPDRCYHCKTELFGELKRVAADLGLNAAADGSHAEDGLAGDHRPGLEAGAELQVRSPLREAGFTKANIRDLARALGLRNWDKPSFACLSSRFPYGTTITAELLARLDACEQLLRELGFRQFRVRHHDTVARIELEPGDIPRAVDLRATIVAGFRRCGYTYVSLDLEGYRSGKMNDTLTLLSKPPTRAAGEHG
ncbi:MAG: ATP-dependent sacrificial sulfur transferase LarE [Armatimonadetes bacterium]|nr:ATP-dependent sacrificial sulfur transferase LarE [Armatimonadota bacterium]MDE2205605.1 ATP-dependent sacrificial sulfur transferase LarE [Armatimonadota bacterium]